MKIGVHLVNFTLPGGPATIASTQIGTRTPVLGHDGADLAAALQTIREVGDVDALDAAVDHAFPGSRVEVVSQGGRFDLLLHQRGLRPGVAAVAPTQQAPTSRPGSPPPRRERRDRPLEGVDVADLADGLQRRRQVCAVMAEHLECESLSGSRAPVPARPCARGVEPPRPDALAQQEQVRRDLRIGELAEHAVVRLNRVVHREPRAVVVPAPYDAAATVGQQWLRGHRAAPRALDLDLRDGHLRLARSPRRSPTSYRRNRARRLTGPECRVPCKLRVPPD